jgi:hypothetical protein
MHYEQVPRFRRSRLDVAAATGWSEPVCRAGLSPAEVQRLSRRTVSTASLSHWSSLLRRGLHHDQELWRHLIDQPDAIVRRKELEPLSVHANRVHFEDSWLAVSLSDTLRGSFVRRQVHLLARLRLQPFAKIEATNRVAVPW